MKEIKLFMFEACPHCKRAREIIEELLSVHPEYRDIPFEMIDEKLCPEIADKYDYYYVPTFFVGGEKLHEGVPTLEAIERVFKTAFEKEGLLQ